MDGVFKDRISDAVLSRRRLITLAAAGVAGTAASSLLAACGGDDSEADATSPPEPQSEATSPQGSEPAPTSAPESETESTSAPTSDTSGSSGDAKKGGRLRVAYVSEPKNLHPQIDSGTEGVYVQMQIYDSLLIMGKNGEFIPGLAEEWPETPDDRTYIFKLRKNVVFHNGKPFTADDVIWSYDRLLGKVPDQQSTQAERFGAQIESVEKTDDYTIKITLKQPWSDLIPLMAGDKYMRILQKDAMLEAGEDYGQSVVVGTGPFKFVEWVKGDHLTLERNEDYWGDEVYLDEIVYQAIPEDSTRMLAFKAGEIDVLLVPAFKDIADYEDDPNFTILTSDSGNMKRVQFNTTQPPFDDKKVRQAINYGVNRQEIVDAIYYGYATVGQGILPPWHPAFNPDQEYYPYDPEKAKQLLSEAGYSDGSSLEFEIVTSEATEYVDTATLIQAQLEQIGVRASILPLDASAMTAKTFSQPAEGGGFKANPGFQAYLYRLIYGFPTTDYGWRTYHPDSALNASGYNQPGGAQNPEVVELLDEANQISDVEEQKKIYSRLSDLIMDDALVVNIGFQQNVVMTPADVKDLGIAVITSMPLRGVWLDR